jgi:hypothetical protein
LNYKDKERLLLCKHKALSSSTVPPKEGRGEEEERRKRRRRRRRRKRRRRKSSSVLQDQGDLSQNIHFCYCITVSL